MARPTHRAARAGNCRPCNSTSAWLFLNKACSYMAYLSQNHLPLPRQAAHQAGQTPLGSTAWFTQFVLPAKAVWALSMQLIMRADSQALTQTLALPALALA